MRYTRPLHFILTFILVANANVSCNNKESSKDDKKIIEEMLTERFIGFQSSTDPLEQAELYIRDVSDDATWMPPNDEIIQGKDNIKKWAEWFFSTYKLVVDPDRQYVEEPLVEGDLAYRRFTSGGYYVEKSTGDSIWFDQKYIDLFKRVNGQWKIVAHMWSSNDLGESIWNTKADSN